jgi:hypothetical protein
MIQGLLMNTPVLAHKLGLQDNNDPVAFLKVVEETIVYLRLRSYAGMLITVGHLAFAAQMLTCSGLTPFGSPVVVPHHHIRVQLPPMHRARLPQRLLKRLRRPRRLKHIPPVITPVDHVIQRPLVLDPQFSCHFLSQSIRAPSSRLKC